MNYFLRFCTFFNDSDFRWTINLADNMSANYFFLKDALIIRITTWNLKPINL